MEPTLSKFNWSLSKLLVTEGNPFEKAKLKILYTILFFSLIKIVIAITTAWYFEQVFQLDRAIIMLFIYAALIKILLANKSFAEIITHAMICLGLVLIWSNILVSAQNVNVLTTQFIFMLILSSFYLLEIRASLIYSFLAILPVILYIVFQQRVTLQFIVPTQLASPGFEFLMVLNFATIIVSHYLFRQAFVDNLSEKEALNVQLSTAVKEANQAAESKSDFLSTMSHELRTPLNSVIGISELLLHNTHTKEQEENLNILKFSADNLHTLINDILDFNKLGSGKLALEEIPVDIESLFNDLSKGLRFQAEQKDIDYILDIDKAIVGRRVISDPTRISQIIYNLAGNAIKFTEKGSVTVRLDLLAADHEKIDIRVSICDTGIGISLEKQEAIFEPFTQANSSTTRNFGGTGLGLAIVKRLLALFNSTIHVESLLNKGSVFFFDLSLMLDLEAYSRSKIPESEFDLSGIKILVAEDNAMNRILLMKIFSKWNCEWEFAVNGKEAVDMMASGAFNVVLMDLHMPVMDGYEAAKAIRAIKDPIKSSISIIALTASVSGNLNEKTRAAGMNGFVLKPFKLNELYARLKEESSHTPLSFNP